MAPKISVVIPLFNKGPHIERTLNSVLKQLFQDFEVIVVDDGSTDRGAEIVKGFDDSRIRLIQQENHGVSAARNRGIEEARADFIAFLDADDEWMPDHLEVLLRLQKKYPEAGAYTTTYLTIHSDSLTKKPHFYGIPEKPWEGILQNYFKSAALGSSPMTASTVGIFKNILIEIGAFNIAAHGQADSDLWVRIALKYPIAFSWDGEGLYHFDASNRFCDSWTPLEENISVSTAWNAIESGEVPEEMYEDFLEYTARLEIETAYRNLKAGRADLAQKNLKHCRTKHLKCQKYPLLFCTYLPFGIFKRLLIFEDFVKKINNLIIK